MFMTPYGIKGGL